MRLSRRRHRMAGCRSIVCLMTLLRKTNERMKTHENVRKPKTLLKSFAFSFTLEILAWIHGLYSRFALHALTSACRQLQKPNEHSSFTTPGLPMAWTWSGRKARKTRQPKLSRQSQRVLQFSATKKNTVRLVLWGCHRPKKSSNKIKRPFGPDSRCQSLWILGSGSWRSWPSFKLSCQLRSQ